MTSFLHCFIISVEVVSSKWEHRNIFNMYHLLVNKTYVSYATILSVHPDFAHAKLVILYLIFQLSNVP